MDFMDNLGVYRKFIVALAGALLGWGTLVVTSEPALITSSEWLSLGTGLATAFGVYQIRNDRI